MRTHMTQGEILRIYKLLRSGVTEVEEIQKEVFVDADIIKQVIRKFKKQAVRDKAALDPKAEALAAEAEEVAEGKRAEAEEAETKAAEAAEAAVKAAKKKAADAVKKKAADAKKALLNQLK